MGYHSAILQVLRDDQGFEPGSDAWRQGFFPDPESLARPMPLLRSKCCRPRQNQPAPKPAPLLPAIPELLDHPRAEFAGAPVKAAYSGSFARYLQAVVRAGIVPLLTPVSPRRASLLIPG